MTSPSPVRENDEARLAEIEALARAGAAGTAPLMAMLEDRSWVARRAVVSALGALGDVALPALCASLAADRADETRIAATVDAIVASSGDAEAALEALAVHEDPAVVADVAQILGRRRNPRSVQRLVTLLAHADDNVAVTAIEALGRIGGRAAIDALVTAVRSKQFFRTFPAIDVLGRSGDPRAIGPLAELLADSRYVQEAARALGRTGHRASVEPLAALVTSAMSDATIRVAALALADVVDRHKQTYGDDKSIEDALRAFLGDAAIRRLARALTQADAAEQGAICVILGALENDGVVPVLTRLLDGPPAVASIAGRSLQRHGRESDQRLLKAIEAGDSARRQVLLPLLTRSRGPEVLVCLQDPDPTVRAMACEALARLGYLAAVPALFDLLADDNPRVVQAAVGAIQSLGTSETTLLARGAAASPSPTVRRAALRILSYFGRSEALDVFVKGIADEDPRVRDAAVQGLPFLEGADALDALFSCCTSPSERIRASAMRALGQTASDMRVPAHLLRGVSDPDPWVRYYACQSLGKLALEISAEPIAKLLGDEAGQVRVAAIEALSHLKSPVAVQALLDAAVSPDVDIRRAALIGLGMGQRPASLPLLLDAAVLPEAATRLVALAALAEFPAPQVLPVLARACADPDEGVRSAAIGFLASRSDVDATRILVDLLAQAPPSAEARAALLTALSLPSPSRVTGLALALESADAELAPLLTSLLARMRRADASAVLFSALTLPNASARIAAATTLAAVGGREALAALRKLAADDASPEVRKVASLLLSQ